MDAAGAAELRSAAPAARRGTRPWARARHTFAASIPVLSWAILVVAAWGWGTALNARGADILLWAPPLYGRWDLDVGIGVAIPVAVATAIVVVAPLARDRLGWRSLLAVAWGGAAAWPLALALAHGPGEINLPLENPNEYLPAVALVTSPGELLATFTERIGDYTTHVRSHPPGMLLGLWALDAVGVGGSWPAALAVVAVGASATPAVLVALRTVAGEPPARRAAPFLVLLPAAVWIATSADALFMGVGAWAVCLLVVATVRGGRAADLAALGGGVAFGAALFLSYGLVLLAAIPLAVASAERRLRALAIGAAAALAVVLAFAVAGFWWVDGFFAVREQYEASIARNRPYGFFLLNNLAAFALAVGPVLVLALARLRDRRAWLLVGGALAAVALADLSGMSKGEVERIWLPFVPWVALAAAALPSRLSAVRALLAAQAALAIAIQVGVRTAW